MLWDSVSQALTGDSSFLGTENKSYSLTESMPLDRGVKDMVRLLNSQFLSPPHYAQAVGKEYGQIGLAIVYTSKSGSYQQYRITEVIKVGEVKPGDLAYY